MCRSANLPLAVPQNSNLQPCSLSKTQVGFPEDGPIPLGSRAPTQAQEIKNGFFSSSWIVLSLRKNSTVSVLSTPYNTASSTEPQKEMGQHRREISR